MVGCWLHFTGWLIHHIYDVDSPLHHGRLFTTHTVRVYVTLPRFYVRYHTTTTGLRLVYVPHVLVAIYHVYVVASVHTHTTPHTRLPLVVPVPLTHLCLLPLLVAGLLEFGLVHTFLRLLHTPTRTHTHTALLLPVLTHATYTPHTHRGGSPHIRLRFIRLFFTVPGSTPLYRTHVWFLFPFWLVYFYVPRLYSHTRVSPPYGSFCPAPVCISLHHSSRLFTTGFFVIPLPDF